MGPKLKIIHFSLNIYEIIFILFKKTFLGSFIVNIKKKIIQNYPT